MGVVFKEPNEIFVGFYHSYISDKKVDSKMISLLACIRFGSSLSGEYTTSIEYLVKKMGYKPDRNKGKINDKIVYLLEQLELHNHIFILPKSLAEIKNTEVFTIQINLNNNIFDVFETDRKKRQHKNFVMLYQYEYEKIISIDSKSNKSSIVRTFLNIKKHWDMSDDSSYSHPYYGTLAKECNITSISQIIGYIKDLKNVGLLPYSYCSGSYLTKSGKRENAFVIFSRSPIDSRAADEYTRQAILYDKKIKITHFDPVAKPGAKVRRDKISQEKEDIVKSAYDLEAEQLSNQHEREEQELY